MHNVLKTVFSLNNSSNVFWSALLQYLIKSNMKLIRYFWKLPFYCSCYCYITNKNTTDFYGFVSTPFQSPVRFQFIVNMSFAWLRGLQICLATTSQLKNHYLQHREDVTSNYIYTYQVINKQNLCKHLYNMI